MRRAVIVLLALGALSVTGCSQPGFQALGSESAHPAGSVSAGPVNAQALAKSPKHYVGVAETGTPPSFRPVTLFSNATKVRPNLVLYYSGWYEPFQTALARTAYENGAALLVQINPRTVSLRNVAAGRYDAYLRSYADEVRSFGHLVVIGFAHEMNGGWYPWGVGHTSARVWVAAWRHVVTVFRSAGADNVAWLWTASHLYSNRYGSYWPGSKFVTWVGIDGYLTGRDSSFERAFGAALTAIRRLTRSPILLSETGAGPLTHHQAADIASLFTGVKLYHLLGLVYYDIKQSGSSAHQDWRLEGHPALLKAFRLGARLLGVK